MEGPFKKTILAEKHYLFDMFEMSMKRVDFLHISNKIEDIYYHLYWKIDQILGILVHF